jgi:hypothetical protein
MAGEKGLTRKGLIHRKPLIDFTKGLALIKLRKYIDAVEVEIGKSKKVAEDIKQGARAGR